MTSISDDLLKILVCPETKEPLRSASTLETSVLNENIAAGKVVTRAGEVVREPIEAALIRSDERFAYIVRNGLPIMLIGEALAL